MNCTFQLLFEIYKLGKVRFQNVAKEVINDFQIMSISTITYLQKFRHKFLFDFFMEKHFMFYQVLLTNRKYSFKQIACQPYIKTVAFCAIDFINCIDVRLQWYCNSL